MRANVWTSIVGLWVIRRFVTFSAALSGLTCSFSPLWVFCGLLLPLQPFWLPLALRRPLFLLTWWEVRLTPFWELHTEMPLSAVEPCSRGGSDGKIVLSAYGRITTKHYTSGCFSPTVPCIFFIFLSITHWTGMQQKLLRSNFCHRACIRTALPTADFNLYLKPSSTRGEVNRGKRSYQASAGKKQDYNHCCVFNHSLQERKWLMKINISFFFF